MSIDELSDREDADDPERERAPLPTTAFTRANKPLTCGFLAWGRRLRRLPSATLRDSKRAQSAPSEKTASRFTSDSKERSGLPRLREPVRADLRHLIQSPKGLLTRTNTLWLPISAYTARGRQANPKGTTDGHRLRREPQDEEQKEESTEELKMTR